MYKAESLSPICKNILLEIHPRTAYRLNQTTKNKWMTAYWSLRHRSMVSQALSCQDECGNPFFKKHVTI